MAECKISENIAKAGDIEVNLVSWYGKPEKVDIRRWDESHEKPGKGLTMTMEEFEKLKEAIEKC